MFYLFIDTPPKDTGRRKDEWRVGKYKIKGTTQKKRPYK